MVHIVTTELIILYGSEYFALNAKRKVKAFEDFG